MILKDKHTVCWISLGCPKNLVDTERVLGRLLEGGWILCADPEEAEIVIVNTCGFVQDAVEESKQILRDLSDLKKNGGPAVVAAGCLVERLGNDLSSDLPEVDAFVGLCDADEIDAACKDILRGRGRLYTRKERRLHKDTGRLRVTPPHYAYLQITDGCDNRCSYCVIPLIRGGLRSKPFADVIAEADELYADGVRELNIIGQDTTSYGRDLDSKKGLADILKAVSELDFEWIRLLYTHPAHLSDDVIEVIAKNDKIVNYIDLPIQHINDDLLKTMNRHVGREQVESLIRKVRNRIPNVVLRTSLIVGLPGETEEAFEELLDFVEETRFERLGAFAYSHEEGVPAYDFAGQVPERIKRARLRQIMQLQQQIAAEHARSLIGKTMDVVIEGKSRTSRRFWEGRTWADAPDVDGLIYLKGKNLQPGTFAKARITGSRDYDLEGEVIA